MTCAGEGAAMDWSRCASGAGWAGPGSLNSPPNPSQRRCSYFFNELPKILVSCQRVPDPGKNEDRLRHLRGHQRNQPASGSEITVISFEQELRIVLEKVKLASHLFRLARLQPAHVWIGVQADIDALKELVRAVKRGRQQPPIIGRDAAD